MEYAKLTNMNYWKILDFGKSYKTKKKILD